MKNYFEKLRKSQDKKVIRLNKGDIKLSLKQQEEIIEMFKKRDTLKVGDFIFYSPKSDSCYKRWQRGYVHELNCEGENTLFSVGDKDTDSYGWMTFRLSDFDIIIK